MSKGLPRPANLRGYTLVEGVFWPEGWAEGQCPYNPPGTACSLGDGCAMVLGDNNQLARIAAAWSCSHAVRIEKVEGKYVKGAGRSWREVEAGCSR